MLALLTNKFVLAGAGILLVVAFLSGWKLRDYQADSDELAGLKQVNEGLSIQIQEIEAELKARDKKAADLESKLSKRRAGAALAQPEIAREYAKDIYTNCSIPANGMRIIDNAILRANEAITTR